MSMFDVIADAAYDTLKEQAADLWEEAKENKTFLKEIAMKMADQAIKIGISAARGDDVDIKLRKEALADLEAAVRIRIFSESIRIKAEKHDTFITIMTTVGRMMLNLALKSAFPASPGV